MSATRFRKKPVVVEAMLVTTDNVHEAANWCDGYINAERDLDSEDPYIEIRTLEGTMRANVGDWIIRGVKGEFYPCKAAIFDATYEAAD